MGKGRKWGWGWERKKDRREIRWVMESQCFNASFKLYVLSWKVTVQKNKGMCLLSHDFGSDFETLCFLLGDSMFPLKWKFYMTWWSIVIRAWHTLRLVLNLQICSSQTMIWVVSSTISYGSSFSDFHYIEFLM